ncbi:uncharacterized protein F5147DRAFT_649877 [Suillus discolor]|uniref:Uncharacterized protein n=1 Tax=Suillus discolor TaxID=1912936 RepID=A0A9P7JY78_9AGAM|nr:uncharacterized protein F5147DRAFT_649877 [Suillus discolor]KAG2114720.1 hypothetical protein F5147DRAFT_649877 [Suillus discolor]
MPSANLSVIMAYKQLWVTLWDQPHICIIHKKINAYIWQSSLTSNVAMSDIENEDFTSDLICLAITNVVCKESNNFPGHPTTDYNLINISDIPGQVTPTPFTITPSAPAILMLAPGNTTTAPNPPTFLLAILAPGPPVVSAATAASEVPSAAAV